MTAAIVSVCRSSASEASTTWRMRSATRVSSSVEAKDGKGKKSERAKAVGAALGEKAKAKGIAEAVFDRGGYRYHGRVKALGDAARSAGLRF